MRSIPGRSRHRSVHRVCGKGEIDDSVGDGSDAQTRAQTRWPRERSHAEIPAAVILAGKEIRKLHFGGRALTPTGPGTNPPGSKTIVTRRRGPIRLRTSSSRSTSIRVIAALASAVTTNNGSPFLPLTQ